MRLWVGEHSAVSGELLAALALWTTMYNVSSALAMLFNAANVIRFQVIWASIMAAANLGLSIWLTHQVGIVGVVLGSIVSYVFCIFIPYFLYVPKLFAKLETRH
jgi:O-antigen/teichoic acid export membrane protein